MAGGEYIPPGLMNLGTDLSDDHPVSFHYTSGLAAADRQLKNPNTVPPEVKLDAEGQLQCTTCHDAHGSKYRMFLTWDDAFGALCETCHDMTGWRTGSHKTSGQDVSGITDTDWPYATVAENACRSCHRSHTAGNPERLLLYRQEEDNCLDCHNGRAARHDIVTQLNKFSTHDPRRYTGIHDPAETWGGDRPHVECVDCHNPHAADQPTEIRGYTAIGETMKAVPGISIGGRPVLESRFEYEVCFRCHGDQPVPITRRISRQSDQANMRLKFRATNPSFHPLVTASVGRNAASLDPSIPRGSLIRCIDCHNNDDGPRADGAGPDGPHGSIYDFLLERNYSTNDDTPESTYAYALCYKCHRRASILADESFPTHALHVRDSNTPCSACHDPHGVSRITGTRSDHTHLINFDTTIVRPLTGTTRLNFADLGYVAGSCTLTCHGVDHDNLEYGR
jgi:predicted CXXCH cytochrome family protein